MLKKITPSELRERLQGMPPEEKDQLLGDILEQLNGAIANKDLDPNVKRQLNEARTALRDAMEMRLI